MNDRLPLEEKQAMVIESQRLLLESHGERSEAMGLDCDFVCVLCDFDRNAFSLR